MERIADTEDQRCRSHEDVILIATLYQDQYACKNREDQIQNVKCGFTVFHDPASFNRYQMVRPKSLSSHTLSRAYSIF